MAAWGISAVRRVVLPLALLLYVVFEFTSAVARDTEPGARSGYDLQLNLRAPARALVDGDDPYDPANLDYREEQQVTLPAGVYAPHALVLHGPISALPLDIAAPVYAGLSAVAIAAAILLVDRRLHRVALGTAVVVAALLSGHAVRSNLELGQPTPWLLLGVVLYLWGRTDDRSWLGAVGVALACMKLQLALPILVLALLLGDRRIVLRASVAMSMIGLPVVVQVLRAAGGLGDAVSSIRRNLDFYADLPGNSGLSASARIDLSAAVGRVAEVGVAVDLLCTAAVLGAVWWFVIRPGRMTPATTTMVVSVAPLLCLYHQRYDVLLLIPAIAAAKSLGFVVLALVAGLWSWPGERLVEAASGLDGVRSTSLSSALTTVMSVLVLVEMQSRPDRRGAVDREAGSSLRQ